MTVRTALLISLSPIAFARRPVIGRTPEGRPLYETTPANAQVVNGVIGHLYAIPAGALIDGDPVMARSADSAAMLEYWELSDTLVDGADAIRKAAQVYLPKFTDEGSIEYNFRRKMTKYTNVYRDIIESLSSKPFEQEVTLIKDGDATVPTEIEAFAENVDGAGNNITAFAAHTFFNGINSAIDWIFVDFPPEDAKIITQADAKASGRRPYWSHVLGRNVLWATAAVINGQETLTYAKIYEPGAPDHVREFIRDESGSVTWRLLQKQATAGPSGKPQWLEVGAGAITIGVIPLVPFATGRRNGRTFQYHPPMRDAADLSIELYQQESGLKFAKMLTAYPMLSGNGVKPITGEDGSIKKLAVGPGRVLYAPPSGDGRSGSWSYVEPSAQSLTFLAADIKETISQLRELGRQPLTAQSGNMTVITAATAAGKAKSAVGAWALSLKNALENALIITGKWMALRDYKPQVNVYDEFDDFAEGKDLDALQAMRDGDVPDISQETFWEEMKRRGVLSEEFDPERERDRLLKEVPADDGTEDDPAPPKPGDPKPAPAKP